MTAKQINTGKNHLTQGKAPGKNYLGREKDAPSHERRLLSIFSVTTEGGSVEANLILNCAHLPPEGERKETSFKRKGKEFLPVFWKRDPEHFHKGGRSKGAKKKQTGILFREKKNGKKKGCSRGRDGPIRQMTSLFTSPRQGKGGPTQEPSRTLTISHEGHTNYNPEILFRRRSSIYRTRGPKLRS